MIPILFPGDATTFTSAGLGGLPECTFCEVTEERNGIFECEFRYPVNGPMFKQIRPGRIVYVPYDVTGAKEPFDIYAYDVDLTGMATFRAHHISYRYNTVLFQPETGIEWSSYGTPTFRVLRSTESYAYSHGSPLNLPKYLDDLTIVGKPGLPRDPQGYAYRLYYSVYKNGVSLRDAIMGQSSSLLSGNDFEIQWNYPYATLYKRRGTDTTAVIRYASNLSAMRYEYDNSSVVDAVIPYWYDKDAEHYRLLTDLDSDATSYPYPAIAAPSVGNTPYKAGDRFTAVFLDVSQQFSSKPTADAVFNYADEYYDANALGIAYENLTIDFQPLWQTAEYSAVAPAEKLKLCDTAQVFIPELDINKRMKVCKTVWDVLNERYTRMEFGSSQRTIFTVNYNNGTAEESDEGTVIIVDEDIPEGDPIGE